jgi:two-component system response regulator FixJ
MQTDSIVHVIDDDDAMRDSLLFLFKSAGIPVATYESALAFLNEASKLTGGCIVTDIRMPEMSGLDLLKKLKDDRSPLPVILITGHGDIPLAVEAMKLGAIDFIEKPFDDGDLLSAVKVALSRQKTDTERQFQQSVILARLDRLSSREREVLNGLIAGHPNKTIAYDLGISPRTIEIYRANVMTKMKAGSLSELIRMALISKVGGT